MKWNRSAPIRGSVGCALVNVKQILNTRRTRRYRESVLTGALSNVWIDFYLHAFSELLEARITSETVIERIDVEFKRKTIALLAGFFQPRKRFLFVPQTSVDLSLIHI